jgi:hypothetical protein
LLVVDVELPQRADVVEKGRLKRWLGPDSLLLRREGAGMMGDRRVDQAKLFYEFSLEQHVPQDHLLRAVDRFVDLDGVRARLAPFYSPIGRT